MSTRTVFNGTIFLVGISALIFAVYPHGKNQLPDSDTKNPDESVVLIEWRTLNHKYGTPKTQPWIYYQWGDGGDSGNKPIMKPGVDSVSKSVRKGRHILAWVSVNQIETSSDAVQTVKIFVDGVQKCGPGFDDQGNTRGAHNAICEAIS